jgi:SAM-dependent methyltransferase
VPAGTAEQDRPYGEGGGPQDMGSGAVQGRLWGGAARDWADSQEPTMTPCYEAVFDAIGLGGDDHLLDAGCGAGLAMQLATKRGARPTGLDAAAGMLSVAWERLPHADVRHGELEQLPFDDDIFDAVTAFDSLQYTDDPVAALRELRRVARPDAPVAVLSWAEPDRCESHAVFEAVTRLLPPAAPGTPGTFALAGSGTLPALATEAGLRPEKVAEVAVTFGYRNIDVAIRAQLSRGPAQRAIAYVGRQATAESIAAALAHLRRPDGSYRMDNVFRYLLARA